MKLQLFLAFLVMASHQSVWARGSRPTPMPHDVIANNIYTITPTAEEHCEAVVPFKPDRKLQDGHHGRLKKELREIARAANPFENLKAATLLEISGNHLMANAYADLSVTGQRALAAFKQLHNEGKITEENIVAEIEVSEIGILHARDALILAAKKMIDRSYKVMHVIGTGNSAQRGSLGYIAVSGEDDQPYRPVNASATTHIQYDMDVMVQGHKVRTRYMIAESKKFSNMVPVWAGERKLVEAKIPQLSDDAKVLIFVHGMDSRLEEAEDLFRALQKISETTGENWTMISMDLPTSGYADKLEHMKISPIQEIGNSRAFPPGFDARGRHHVPILNFMENFIVSFVDTLDQKVVLKNKIKAVIGGSLGGNMTFRLGRRHDLPWLKNVVTWSPASIWDGLADGGDVFKQLGVATAWKRAGGDAENLIEKDGDRGQYFRDSFGGRIDILMFNVVPAQPDQWWRTNWACFSKARESAEVERYEIYHPNFRTWHWRLGAEQLIFSQQYAPNLSEPRFMQNHVRMLLACGEKDDFNYTNICSSTLRTAQQMTRTPGTALIFKNTGHSIPNERPMLFAKEIEKFLK